LNGTAPLAEPRPVPGLEEGFLASLVFLGAWSFFLAGASPSIYGGDSGELVASAAALGISHAPGYPLHALLGKAAVVGIPWGPAAFRVNLLSSFLTAATVAGLFLFLKRTVSWVPALVAALFYASLPIVRDQAQVAEVFALNNAFALGLLALVALGRGSEAVKPRGLALAAFLAGLGLHAHQTLVFLAPGLVLLAARVYQNPGSVPAGRSPARARLKMAPAGLLFFLLGYSAAFYLPIRAAQHPPVNFGDPHTPGRLRDLLTRKEFGTLELHPAALPFRTLSTAAQQTGAFLRQSREQAGAVGLVLGLAGLLVLARRRKGSGFPPTESAAPAPAGLAGLRSSAWLVSWILCGPVFYLMSNLSPFNTLALWRLERFLLLPCLFIAVGVAAGLQALLQRRWIGLAGILAVGMAAEHAWTVSGPWFRWNLAFRDFGRNVCASLAPESILLIDRVLFDEPTSCVLHSLVVEQKRRDVRVIYRPGTLFELFYGEDILEIPRDQRLARQREREEALWRARDRPLAALAFARENLPPGKFQLQGLLYQADSRSQNMEAFYRRADLFEPRRPDYPTRLIRVHDPYMSAKAAFDEGRFPAAAQHADRALALGHDMEWLFSNVGALFSRNFAETPHAAESLSRAGAAFHRCVAIDPYFAQGHFGRGYVALRRNDFAAAATSFSVAARLRPEWPEARYMEGLAHRFAGDSAKAQKAWNAFLRLDPDSPLAQGVREALREPQIPRPR
jgi:tetratricopeptide (TPR) repeat protein